MTREVRIRQRHDFYDGKKWHFEFQPVVEVDSKAWVMVRRADSPNAAPFVITRKEWDKLEVQS